MAAFHYTFRADGTYTATGTGIFDPCNGTYITRGHYYAMGGVLYRYGNRETWIPKDPNNPYRPPYENKPVSDDRDLYHMGDGGNTVTIGSTDYTKS